MSVRGAYGVLVSMVVITHMIPYLSLFAAVIRVQREPAGRRTIRVPGGRPGAVILGSLDFLTTAAAIVLSVFPGPDEPRPALAVAAVLGLTILNVGSGALIHVIGLRHRALASSSSYAT